MSDTIDQELVRATFAAVLGSARSGAGARGIPNKTFGDLDWDILCQEIADRCVSLDAAEIALELGLMPTPEIALQRRREVDEAAAATIRGDAPPLRAIDALNAILLRARKYEVLIPEDLLKVARSARVAGDVARWSRGASQLPWSAAHAGRLSGLERLYTLIERSIEPNGEVADSASKELGTLRRRVSRLRDGIVARLESIVTSPRYEGILQDNYVTIRDERYVLPIRAGEKGDFPGIVHGQSGSGQTLFIEPRELVEANNALRLAQLDVENEIRRILIALSTEVRESADALEENQDILVYLDVTFAAGRLMGELQCLSPRLDVSVNPQLTLIQARHPILALRALRNELEVVPNSLNLGGRQGFIISGPNTGGKTITLKTIGLFALMTRAGLPIPVDEGSVIPWFDHIHSDIGDGQGVERDLSTFSAHVANIVNAWPEMGPGTLVLLDELFAGTDPSQGAALGRALVGKIVDRGAMVAVTTHLESLKTLGLQDDRFAIASVSFDVEALRPTFALRMGLPGSSYAFRIADRLGLDPEVIRIAEEGVESSGTLGQEELIERLENEHREQRALRADAQAALERARKEEARALQIRKKAEERETREMNAELEELKKSIRALREEARDRARALRAMAVPKTQEELQEAQREVERARETATKGDHSRQEMRERLQARTVAREGVQEERSLAMAALRPGAKVWVRNFSREGTILEIDLVGHRADVQIGPLRTKVALRDLEPPRSGELEPQPRIRPAFQPAETTDEPATHALDLRGERVDDALEQLLAFLDRAARRGGGPLTVVHGHGTGALKRAVREELSRAPYPIRWRAGEQGEGGDGATIVTFGDAEADS